MEFEDQLLVLVPFAGLVLGVLVFFLTSPKRSPWQRRPSCPVCGRLGGLGLVCSTNEDEAPARDPDRRLRVYRCRHCQAVAITRVLDPEG
jgi:hypothetical protein